MLNGVANHPIRRKLLPLTAILCALAFAVAACGGDDNSSSGSGKSTTTVDLAALGTPNKATGSPVTVGMISESGSGANGTGALVVQGAKMAVKWANDYQGGLAGHELELFICENQATPAGGQDCANQMVQKKVAAVVTPFTGQGAAEVPIITKAGIPYITLSGASAEELTTDGSFALTGGFPSVLGAYALRREGEGLQEVRDDRGQRAGCGAGREHLRRHRLQERRGRFPGHPGRPRDP